MLNLVSRRPCSPLSGKRHINPFRALITRMKSVALTAILLFLTALLAAQSPVPLRGGDSGRQGVPGQRGAGASPQILPPVPTAVELPTITAPISGPGPMF